MKKLFITAILLIVVINIVAAQETVDMLMMQKIKDEEKNNSQIALIAHSLTDVCGPRLTNSPGYNKALDLAIEICKKWGIQKAGREAWGEFGKGWQNESLTLALKAPYYENMIAYPVPWCKSTGKAVRAELVMLDYLDSASIDKLGEAIKGKIVMIKPGSLSIPDAFKPFATRFGDSSLDNLPDTYMFTADQLNQYLPSVKSE